ncbi:putative sensor domain DACNV-containing protein [Gimesia chilikensis]|uniref:putative sensor domain DACNV-containing protein n=1 Tax=Gimesia chilikensis TaxID=2605989 RepID=UPI003A912ACA
MSEYSFPRDLLDSIKTRWQNIPDEQFSLPEDTILSRLLETCYHASFRTSEQRLVQCVVAYVSIDDLPQEALRLTELVQMTDSELVRLSPVTQHRQTVIGCYQVDEWLGIWGFFEHGQAWVQHSAGDPPAVPMQPGDYPPDCLMITIEGPGALTVSQGRTGLVRLRNGRVIFPQVNLLQTIENPLGEFFYQVVNHLLTLDQYQKLARCSDETEGQFSLQNIYTTSVLAILERIRLKRHGGSVVIAPVSFDQQLAHITYTVSEHTGLFDEIVAYKYIVNQLRDLDSGSSAEVHSSQIELALRRASQELIRGISQISLLAAVDGAVILDDHLRVQGFGVRFPVLLPPGSRVEDALSKRKYSCDRWGLRHQSVFSFCHKCEQAIGLIVSQDGEVKAVKAEQGQLYFWDGILN